MKGIVEKNRARHASGVTKAESRGVDIKVVRFAAAGD